MAGVVLVGSNAFVLSPILSEVATSFDSDPVRVAWAISSFGAATALSALLLSPLTDRHGPRATLTSAAGLMTLAQGLCMVSTGWAGLCAAQALAGGAVGVLLPGIYATATATAPAGRESARLGFVLTGWALSLVLAVPLSASVTEHLGWRPVYGGLALMSALVALGLWHTMPRTLSQAPCRTSPLRAIRLPGVAFLLAVSLGYMIAFYGSYAYFGEGIRHALGVSAGDAGLYVLAYGAGFGLAGLCIGHLAPRPSRRYLTSVLAAIGATYLAWRFVLDHAVLSFGVAALWGFLNQFGLNALIVLLNRRAAAARGAVMGLNSAVTYAAVFAGPFLMGPVYQGAGFPAVTTLAAVVVAASCLAVSVGGRRLSEA